MSLEAHMNGVEGRDLESVRDACVVLRENGFNVAKILDVERTRSGVEFCVTLRTDNRTKGMGGGEE